MALINCPSCGKQVSDQAAACPECAHPLKAGSQPQTIIIQQGPPAEPAKKKKKIGCVGAAAIIVVILIAAGVATRDPAQSPSGSSTASRPAAAPAPPPIEVTARQLLEDYSANEVAGDNKYKGRTLLVTGRVDEIAKDVFGSVVLYLQTGETFNRVMATMAARDDSRFANLSKGQNVTLRCRGNGLLVGSPILDKCALQ